MRAQGSSFTQNRQAQEQPSRRWWRRQKLYVGQTSLEDLPASMPSAPVAQALISLSFNVTVQLTLYNSTFKQYYL